MNLINKQNHFWRSHCVCVKFYWQHTSVPCSVRSSCLYSMCCVVLCGISFAYIPLFTQFLYLHQVNIAWKWAIWMLPLVMLIFQCRNWLTISFHLLETNVLTQFRATRNCSMVNWNRHCHFTLFAA